MKKTVWLLLLLLISARNGLRAQSFNLQTGREPVASLDGLWRFHTGDDPRWADPTFDDSHWPLLRSDRPWTKQGYPDYSGYAWYRFKVQVLDGSKPFGLRLTTIRSGYRVYANGKQIGSESSTAPTRDPIAWAPPEVFRLPTNGAGPQTIQIALCVWDAKADVTFLGGGPQGPDSAVGDPALLNRRLHQHRDAAALMHVNDYTYCLLGTLVGLTVLGLFLLRREDREYLWFSLLLLADAANGVMDLIFRLGSIPYLRYLLPGWAASGLSVIAALMFFFIVLQARRSFWWWVACIAAAASPLPVALMCFQWAGLGASFAVNLCCILPAYIWIVATLSISALRKDTSARLLLAPAALLYGYSIIVDVVQISWIFGWQRKLITLEVPLLRHPFPLGLGDVANYTFVLALLIFLVRRFSLARQEETRLANEMEAARTMQSFLIPATAPRTPGFLVESVYLPASEVGGDFFQVQAAADESLLIVVGDVSGKGLKAAMTVSAIVGGLKQIATRNPAEVLAALNRQLLNETAGGFVTCCAALATSNGKLTLANAGHLSPYRNGSELAVEAGLPLGLVAGSRYEEAVYDFAPGDRVTFISDGVVEARNPRGELYGFARTQHISAQPAAAIADTVKRFGQEDDITVVAITRTADLKNTADVRATPSPSVTV